MIDTGLTPGDNVMSADNAPTTAPQAKYTRYRSVRKAATNQGLPSSSPEELKGEDSDTTHRSMSRYRRNRVASPQSQKSVLNSPPIPMISSQYASPESLQSRVRGGELPSVSSDIQQLESLPQKSPIDEEEQRRAEQQQIKLLLAEQKKRDLERLEAELAAAVASPVLPRHSSPPRDKFGIFARKKETTLRAASPIALDSSAGTDSGLLSKVKSNESPQAILQGGGGIVPGSDAPVSAVNAGERRVLVRCKQSSINLPVTPDTTSVDIVYSAANVISQSVTPSAAVLVESYTKLGLERRIRHYEHIRDVMNSWDRDTQNALILQPSDSPNHDLDLLASSVPKKQPATVTVHMYHSQRPGKWNKRYITLMSSGQIYTSKKPVSKVSDKDVSAICHLSDFDIYTATLQQTRKRLKPPKMYCNAIKSQQKTTMFLSTENFVHFFSTEDSSLANKWYDSVQQWRSWYLVNKMGEGQKHSKSASASNISNKRVVSPGHKSKLSVDDSPYTIGTFQPLLDMKRLDNAGLSLDDEEEENRPRQIPFHLRNSQVIASSRAERERHPPPVSLTRRNLMAPDYDTSDSISKEDSSTFAPTGLLGQTYSLRQRAQKERDIAEQKRPFVAGPSLLNSAEAHRPMTSSNAASASLQRRPDTSSGAMAGLPRSPSRRIPATPLVDLTPKFIEPPQWSKEGKGHGVAPPSGLPLVEAATSPDIGTGVNLPKTNVFQRDTSALVDGGRTLTMGKGREGGQLKGSL